MILLIDTTLLLIVIHLWYNLERKWMKCYVGFDPNNKAWNYFLCDGVADDVQIQAALDALPRWGGWVNLDAGTFDVSGTINMNKKNTWIQGVS